MRRTPLLPGIAVAVVFAATALADYGSRQTADYTVVEERPGHGTAERFMADYINPEDPTGKPPAVRRVVTALPRGARYDPSVPASCTAPDAELMTQGSAACPPESAIGGGVVTVDTGLPGPARIVTADVEFFNNAEDPDGEFIYLNTVRDTDARTVIRADLTRRKRITNADMLPGTPPDGGAIDTVDVTIDEVTRRVDGERRSYITTPPRCRSRGFWRTRVSFTYADGVTQTTSDRNRCEA